MERRQIKPRVSMNNTFTWSMVCRYGRPASFGLPLPKAGFAPLTCAPQFRAAWHVSVVALLLENSEYFTRFSPVRYCKDYTSRMLIPWRKTRFDCHLLNVFFDSFCKIFSSLLPLVVTAAKHRWRQLGGDSGGERVDILRALISVVDRLWRERLACAYGESSFHAKFNTLVYRISAVASLSCVGNSGDRK
jgi:hypothetical protein